MGFFLKDIVHHEWRSVTSLIWYSNIWLEGTSCSFCSFAADSPPAAGTRYSNRFPGAGADPSGSAYGKGRYSGKRPSWTKTVAWSHAMCSWNNRSPRILTIDVNGIRRDFPVGGIPGILLDCQISYNPKDYTITHIQSICFTWVKAKINSSTMRSVPTVRLINSNVVSSGLLKIKWFR